MIDGHAVFPAAFVLLLAFALAAHAGTAAPTPGQLANMSYSGIREQPVRLKNGRWEGKPFVAGEKSRPAVGLVEGFLLTGDLDKDGNDEAVVLLWESSGGSGHYAYLAVVGMRDGTPVNLGTSLIGDRVQVRTGRILGNRIELDVVEPGPHDAYCCPSEKATRSWTFDASGLHVGISRLTGTLSPADLAGPVWVLSRLQADAPPEAKPDITLVFEKGRISGSSACNRYFAGVQAPGEAPPGALRVEKIGSTRMSCPPEVMARETRYLKALAAVTRFGFAAGKLALTWQLDGLSHTMLFVARSPASGSGVRNQPGASIDSMPSR